MTVAQVPATGNVYVKHHILAISVEWVNGSVDHRKEHTWQIQSGNVSRDTHLSYCLVSIRPCRFHSLQRCSSGRSLHGNVSRETFKPSCDYWITLDPDMPQEASRHSELLWGMFRVKHVYQWCVQKSLWGYGPEPMSDVSWDFEGNRSRETQTYIEDGQWWRCLVRRQCFTWNTQTSCDYWITLERDTPQEASRQRGFVWVCFTWNMSIYDLRKKSLCWSWVRADGSRGAESVGDIWS